MPRTKGAKNILNAKQLKEELEALKNGATIPETKVQSNDVLISADIPDKPKTNNVQGASDIRIKVPHKKVKTVKDITHSFGCGNQLCDYEADSKFTICPKCGVTNNWRSDSQ